MELVGPLREGVREGAEAVFVRSVGGSPARGAGSSKMALMLSGALSQAEVVGRSPRFLGRCLWFHSRLCLNTGLRYCPADEFGGAWPMSWA